MGMSKDKMRKALEEFGKPSGIEWVSKISNNSKPPVHKS